MVTELDPPFEALADPTRRAVVQLLSTGPMRAGELAARAGMSRPAMSRHLRTLLAAGIVTDRRSPTDARVRIFTLRPQSIAGMRAWLDQVQAHWSEQLTSFARHVQEGHRS